MRYVLDANIAIAALNGVGGVRGRLETVPGAEVGIPMVAVAELLFGANKSKRREDTFRGSLRFDSRLLPSRSRTV